MVVVVWLCHIFYGGDVTPHNLQWSSFFANPCQLLPPGVN